MLGSSSARCTSSRRGEVRDRVARMIGPQGGLVTPKAPQAVRVDQRQEASVGVDLGVPPSPKALPVATVVDPVTRRDAPWMSWPPCQQSIDESEITGPAARETELPDGIRELPEHLRVQAATTVEWFAPGQRETTGLNDSAGLDGRRRVIPPALGVAVRSCSGDARPGSGFFRRVAR